MKVCTRCGSTNKDKSTQCYYCKVDLTAEGTFILVPNRKDKKKKLALLLLIPMLISAFFAVYFFLDEELFVRWGIPNLYKGQDMEIGLMLGLVSILCLIIMIGILVKDPSKRAYDEDDPDEDPTYLMEITTEEELKRKEAEAALAAENEAEEQTKSADETARETPAEKPSDPYDTAASGFDHSSYEPIRVTDEETRSDAETTETAETEEETPAAATDRKQATVLTENLPYPVLYRNLEEGAPRLEKSTLRSILSAMAAVRLIVLRQNTEDTDEMIAPALGRIFDTPVTVTMGNDTWQTPKDLYVSYDPETGTTDESEFLRGAYRASASPEKAHVLFVQGLSAPQLPLILADLIPFLKRPDVPCRIASTVGSAQFGGYDSSIELKDNVWIFAVVDDTNNAQIPESLNGLYAEIPLRKDLASIEMSVETSVETTPSAKLLGRMAERADDELCVSEDLWKKIDLVEEYLRSIVGFTFNNKLVRHMERYTAVYMATGGSELEAIDSMLAVGLLPMLADSLRSHAQKEEESEETLNHLLDRVFGLDHLPMTADTVRVLGLS